MLIDILLIQFEFFSIKIKENIKKTKNKIIFTGEFEFGVCKSTRVRFSLPIVPLRN